MNKKPQHFITTWPRKTQCPQCGSLIFDGIDEGLPYRITPAPLTIIGELAAALDGRNSYRLLANHIVRRSIDNITTETSQTRPPVYPTHHCAPIDPEHISINHVPETQRFITDKYLEKATPEQDNDQQALLTIADMLNGTVIESPDDQDPPF